MSPLAGCLNRFQLAGAWRLPGFGQAMSHSLAQHGARSDVKFYKKMRDALGHGIKATGIEGVASGNPANSKPRSLQNTMTGYRFHRVFGAGWVEAAEPRRVERSADEPKRPNACDDNA